MTLIAPDRSMFSGQRETGIPVMVKPAFGPTGCCVTGGAIMFFDFITELPLMDISVTTVTGWRPETQYQCGSIGLDFNSCSRHERFFIRPGMTGSARDRIMGSKQRIPGLCVVTLNRKRRRHKTGDGMTGFAFSLIVPVR